MASPSDLHSQEAGAQPGLSSLMHGKLRQVI